MPKRFREYDEHQTIKTNSDYETALKEIERLFDAYSAHLMVIVLKFYLH